MSVEPIRYRSFVNAIVLVAAVALVACKGDGKPAIKIHRYDEGLPDAQAMVDGHATIGKEAVGPLRIGMWRRPAMSFVYAIGARQGADSTDIITVKGLGRDTLTLWFQSDTLRRIVVVKPGPHTTSGIAVGTPDSVLRLRAVPAGDGRWTVAGVCGLSIETGATPSTRTVAVRSITVKSCNEP